MNSGFLKRFRSITGSLATLDSKHGDGSHQQAPKSPASAAMTASPHLSGGHDEQDGSDTQEVEIVCQAVVVTPFDSVIAGMASVSDIGWWEGVIFGTTTLGVFPGANVKPLEPEIAMQTSPRPHEASPHENTPLPVGCPLPCEQPLPRGRRPLRASASLNESRPEGIVAQSTDNATHLERCQSLLEGPLPVDPEPLRALLARLRAAVQETEFLLAQLE